MAWSVQNRTGDGCKKLKLNIIAVPWRKRNSMISKKKNLYEKGETLKTSSQGAMQYKNICNNNDNS